MTEYPTLLALSLTRNDRIWREAWATEEIDWRTITDYVPRRVGQRVRDGWIRVADSCEVKQFARRAS